VNPLVDGCVGAAMLSIEYWLGPAVHYPVVYVLPVSLAAWVLGQVDGCGVCDGSAALRPGADAAQAGSLGTDYSLALATVLRGAVILVMGLWFAAWASASASYPIASSRSKGCSRICAICKNIRKRSRRWGASRKRTSRDGSEGSVLHGVCPHVHRKPLRRAFSQKLVVSGFRNYPRR
jgi:hypothetical protein